MKSTAEGSISETQAKIDLGIAYLEKGLREDAIAMFASVLERDPDHRLARDWLARARGDLFG